MKRFVIFSILLIFLSCSLFQKKEEDDGYVYVKDIPGRDIEEAELNAKKKILEIGLGELVRGESMSIDGQSVRRIIESSTEGYVYDFSVLDKRKKDIMTEIDAKGKVNQKAVKDALRQRIKDIGRPRVMVLIDEAIEGESYKPGNTMTENEVFSQFTFFDFIDKEQFIRILSKEGGEFYGAFDDATARAKALEAASRLEAEILLVGKTEVNNAGDVGKHIGGEVTGLQSMQSVVRFKFINVGTAGIIAALNENAAYPHINPKTGAQESIKKAVKNAYPKVRKQLEDKWKPGTRIRLVLEGLNYDQVVDRGLLGEIRRIPGVNSLVERSGVKERNKVVLEVEALYGGYELYKRMRERKRSLGIDFESKEVKAGLVYIKVSQ